MRILNIRGTSGTGKTTIVRELIERSGAKPAKREGKKVRAYLGGYEGVPIVILGSYETTCGGCDTIPKVSIVADLLHEYADYFHPNGLNPHGLIVFEGLMISHMLGTVGKAMDEIGKEKCILAWLTTPLKVCLERVQERRTARGDTRPFNPDNTIKDFKANELCQANSLRQGFRRVYIDHTSATQDAFILISHLIAESIADEQ